MGKANMEIRNKAKEEGVFLWEIADELRIQESRFSKILRKELPAEEKERILSAIERLAKEVR